MIKKEFSVEEKLRTLYSLQLIDLQIDELQNIRGELPLEVRDLEDDLAFLETKQEKLEIEQSKLSYHISEKKNSIEDAKTLIKKYTEQQENVRNNREFTSLVKEIEYQELEIQLAEKRIKEYKAQIEYKKQVMGEIKEQYKEKSALLEQKKSELQSILNDTEREENALKAKAEEISQLIEPRLLKAYNRIRESVANKMAVVPVERGASGGSFFVIPPQVQMEIASRHKIITDEHSGRILVDAALAQEEKEKMADFIKSL